MTFFCHFRISELGILGYSNFPSKINVLLHIVGLHLLIVVIERTLMKYEPAIRYLRKLILILGKAHFES